MNAHQGNPVCVLSVDRYTADVLREEAKKVLEFGHESYENLRYLGPREQYALSLQFRDAFAVLDAVGWARDPMADQHGLNVPLTDGLIAQLQHRRCDLSTTNLDHLDVLDEAKADDEILSLRSEMTINRLAARALDRLFIRYEQAT
jgi:hypothetical protein